MRKLSGSLKWQQWAKIEATSPFGLLDFLRYERACPATEHDANTLEHALRHWGSCQKLVIVVTKFTETKAPRFLWSTDRLCSGVSLTPVTGEEAAHVERELAER